MTLDSAGTITLQGLGFTLAGAIAQATGPAAATTLAGVAGLTCALCYSSAPTCTPPAHSRGAADRVSDRDAHAPPRRISGMNKLLASLLLALVLSAAAVASGPTIPPAATSWPGAVAPGGAVHYIAFPGSR